MIIDLRVATKGINSTPQEYEFSTDKSFWMGLTSCKSFKHTNNMHPKTLAFNSRLSMLKAKKNINVIFLQTYTH